MPLPMMTTSASPGSSSLRWRSDSSKGGSAIQYESVGFGLGKSPAPGAGAGAGAGASWRGTALAATCSRQPRAATARTWARGAMAAVCGRDGDGSRKPREGEGDSDDRGCQRGTRAAAARKERVGERERVRMRAGRELGAVSVEARRPRALLYTGARQVSRRHGPRPPQPWPYGLGAAARRVRRAPEPGGPGARLDSTRGGPRQAEPADGTPTWARAVGGSPDGSGAAPGAASRASWGGGGWGCARRRAAAAADATGASMSATERARRRRRGRAGAGGIIRAAKDAEAVRALAMGGRDASLALVPSRARPRGPGRRRGVCRLDGARTGTWGQAQGGAAARGVCVAGSGGARGGGRRRRR